MVTVITSAGFVEDLDAPQVFTFSRVTEARDFIAHAPRTGWTVNDDCELVTAAVRFSVYEDNGTDVTDEAIADAWFARCEAR